MKMKSKVALVIALTIVVAAIGGASCFFKAGDNASNRKQGSESTAPRSHVVRPIPTSVVQPLPKLITREFPAKVRANKRVQLAFCVAGQLIELDAPEGRRVHQGEIVARLDPRDYRNARDVAKAKYDDAKQSFERIESLYKHDAVPAAEYDRSKAAFDMAVAELRIRQKALDDTILSAPFDGVVATRFVENHEHIRDKQPIVSIQDISRVEVMVQVPERLIARGGADSLQNITVQLDVDGGRRFEAAVRELSTEADPVTRTYKLVLAMKPPEDIKVFPGMTAMVRAEVSRRKPVDGWTPTHTLIPYAAVVNGEDGKSYVWLIDEKAAVPRRVPVVMGEPRGDGIEIRSGLRPGQRIAVAGVHSLSETMLVRPMRTGGEGLDG